MGAGWEVTSPVLANRDGFVEVDVACRALEEAATRLDLRVSQRRGPTSTSAGSAAISRR